MKPITLLLVDDHAVMRMGLASLLETCRDVKVVGDTGDGESAVRMALRLRPDVVVMDLVMPEMDGVETTRRIVAEWPEANVLVLTTFASSDEISHAFDAGARGAILKSADLDGLLAAIRDVAGGNRHCSAEIEQILADDPPVDGYEHIVALRLDVARKRNVGIALRLPVRPGLVAGLRILPAEPMPVAALARHFAAIDKPLGAAQRTVGGRGKLAAGDDHPNARGGRSCVDHEETVAAAAVADEEVLDFGTAILQGAVLVEERIAAQRLAEDAVHGAAVPHFHPRLVVGRAVVDVDCVRKRGKPVGAEPRLLRLRKRRQG